MGAGASQKEPPLHVQDEAQLVNTNEYERVLDVNGEPVGLRQRTDSEKMQRRQMREAEKPGTASSSNNSTTSSKMDLVEEDVLQPQRQSSGKSSTSSKRKTWERVRRSYRPVKYERPAPTIYPHPRFNGRSVAKKLDKALNGGEKGLKDLDEIITEYSLEQRSQVKKEFRQMTKEDLFAVLRDKLEEGPYLNLVLAMFREPLAFDIDVILTFLKEERRLPALVGFLVQKTSAELTAIGDKFEGLFQRSLQDEIRLKANKQDFADILLSVFARRKKGRGGGEKEEEELSEIDPQYSANALMRESDDPSSFKKALLELITAQEVEEIRETCEAIRQMFEAELIDVIDEILSPEEAEPYKAAVASCDDTAFFFAGCCRDAVGQQDDDCLLRLIAGRSEIDLGDVIDAFDESFNEQLERVIGKRTSGDYKLLLLRIMNAI